MSRLKELIDLSKEVKEKEQARFDKLYRSMTLLQMVMWNY